MRLKNDTENFAASFNITPPYQMRVIHSSKLIYPREIYQRGVQRKRVELIAADFNEYVANEPKISFRNGKYYVVDGCKVKITYAEDGDSMEVLQKLIHDTLCEEAKNCS